MRSIGLTFLAFAVISGSALLGFVLKRYLRANHLDSPTQDAVKLATGVVATLAALVLGLLIASAKQTFDARGAEVHTFVINLTLLDRSMREYDPPLTEARQELGTFARNVREQLWGSNRGGQADALSELDAIRNGFRELDPKTAHNRSLHARYMELSSKLVLAGDELLDTDKARISGTIVAIVDTWLALIFIGFALFAPFNRVTVTAMVLSAAAVAMALFLIIEMNSPFRGYVTVSPRPMDRAITRISM
ncbi:MAG TPA: hypothetical protein VGG57_21895 [Stellaceae bacterium]|jgi:hypothetical protein